MLGGGNWNSGIMGEKWQIVFFLFCLSLYFKIELMFQSLINFLGQNLLEFNQGLVSLHGGVSLNIGLTIIYCHDFILKDLTYYNVKPILQNKQINFTNLQVTLRIAAVLLFSARVIHATNTCSLYHQLT